MDIFKERLTEALQARHMRAAELARRTGLSKARISQYVNGKFVPKPEALLDIAEVLGVSELWLLGKTDDMTPAPSLTIPCPENLSPLRLRRYPVLGEIACGRPILAVEDPDAGYVTAADTTADFCLTAKGDSMIGARIFDGDEVFIQQTDVVENGEIAAVVVEGEATLKRVYYYPEEQKLVLEAENPDYEPLVFIGPDLETVHILGRAVAFQSKLR
ncbi:MAG: helix-turn-helix domain-containing protein [Clostridia bacterium]|nr:helix-turn-helix domain-containing protein [Clostridia bacterium]MBQ7909205.1 helix-turn-helix domain-containing protein [Clostridia bacterium]